jgi:hypothetical protein
MARRHARAGHDRSSAGGRSACAREPGFVWIASCARSYVRATILPQERPQVAMARRHARAGNDRSAAGGRSACAREPGFVWIASCARSYVRAMILPQERQKVAMARRHARAGHDRSAVVGRSACTREPGLVWIASCARSYVRATILPQERPKVAMARRHPRERGTIGVRPVADRRARGNRISCGSRAALAPTSEPRFFRRSDRRSRGSGAPAGPQYRAPPESR